MEMSYGGAMVLPRNYVVMDEDEMTYLEGGGYMSASECRNVVGILGMASGSALMAFAYGAAIVAGISRYAKFVGGFLGIIIGALVGVVVGAIGKIAWGIGYGAVSNRGITINASPFPWDCFVNVY